MTREAIFMVIAAACAASCLPAPGEDAAPALRVPQHGPVPEPPELSGDPSTDAAIELGTALFFDRRLSGSGHTGCDSCHSHVTSFQDNLTASTPDSSYPTDQPSTERNTPSLLNLVYAPVYRWDGSHTDLLETIMFPFVEPNMNLGADVPAAQAELKARLTVTAPAYIPLFESAFGEDIEALAPDQVWQLTARALRAFLTKAVSRDSAFDRWNAGDDSAMSEAAQRGLALFDGKARCAVCHPGPFFTDFSFHNLSTSPPDESGARADEGRYRITKDEADRGKFLTPTLRSAFMTGPYFHDGRVQNVKAVLMHLSSERVLADPNRDVVFQAPLDLTDGEIADIVAFIGALRGEDVGGSIDEPTPGTP